MFSGLCDERIIQLNQRHGNISCHIVESLNKGRSCACWRCERASHFVAAVIFTLTEKVLPVTHDYSKPSIFQWRSIGDTACCIHIELLFGQHSKNIRLLFVFINNGYPKPFIKRV